jgi:hypothetical protein
MTIETISLSGILNISVRESSAKICFVGEGGLPKQIIVDLSSGDSGIISALKEARDHRKESGLDVTSFPDGVF